MGTTPEGTATARRHPSPRARGLPRHAVAEAPPPEPDRPRLLDRVRHAIRARHFSRRTEAAYVAWVRRYILFHGKRHPATMGEPEVRRFLSSLAVDRKLGAASQNQALSALLFLYEGVLRMPIALVKD